MDEKKKRFIVPGMEIVFFPEDDIIATSSGNANWGLDDNTEGFPGLDPEE